MKTLGLPKAYDSLDEVLADTGVQSVHLAVPNVLHYELARRALAAGKHVLRKAAGDDPASRVNSSSWPKARGWRPASATTCGSIR